MRTTHVVHTTLPCCAIAVVVGGTTAQRIVFHSGNYFSPSSQLLRGGRVAGGNDVLSTTFFTKDVFEVEEGEQSETVATITKKTTTWRKRVQTFHLKENITHTLSSAEVDKNFCDPSSPLSLAGYMNGERSMREQTMTAIIDNLGLLANSRSSPVAILLFSEGKSI